MGIDGQWKHRFREKWPECFLQYIPVEKTVHVVIEDFSLRLYKIATKCTDPRDVAIRCCKWILNNYTPELETVIVTFDETAPLAKKPKQDSRDTTATPFTPEEIMRKGINISEDGTGYIEQTERVLRTPSLKHKLYYLCSKYLLNLDFETIFKVNKSIPDMPFIQQSEFSLWIDGARINEHRVYVDDPTCCVISHPKKTMMCMGSFGIGESDLKVVNHISRNRGKTIIVSSYDGDMLPILLLNMRDWINKETGMLDVQVYLDLCTELEPRHERCTKVLNGLKNGNATSNSSNNGNGNGNKKGEVKFDIIDINKLWSNMLMAKGFPILKSLPFPIETMCMLIILCKTDFVEGLKGVGIATIWSAFQDGGYNILKGDEIVLRKKSASKKEMLDFLEDIEISNGKKNSNGNRNITTNSIRDSFQNRNHKANIDHNAQRPLDTIIYPRDNPIVFDKMVFGDSTIRHEIELDERRWWLFLLHVIHYQMFKCAPDLADTNKIIQKINEKILDGNRKKMETMERNTSAPGPSKKSTITMDSMDEKLNEMKMLSLVRRMHWNIDYWINGGKAIFDNVLDCLKVNPYTGLSIHGWLEEKVPILEDNIAENIDYGNSGTKKRPLDVNQNRNYQQQNNKKFKSVVKVAHVVHVSNQRGWNYSGNNGINGGGGTNSPNSINYHYHHQNQQLSNHSNHRNSPFKN
jgi:hypothetical protein